MSPSSETHEGTAQASDTETIRAAQQALNDKGYKAGTVDGVMGPHTAAAIKSFQQAQGLQQSGKLDSSTLAALGVTQRTASTEKVSSTSSTK